MPDRRPRSEDAQPIPQRARRQPKSAGDGLDDDVYTVDTRGRRPAVGPQRPTRRERPVSEQVTPTRRMPGRAERAPSTQAQPPRKRPTGAPVLGDAAPPRRGASDPRRTAQPEANPPRRPRRWGRILALLVALWVAFLVVTPFHAWSSVTRVDDAPAGERPPETPGNTYLLVGSDSRDDLSAEERKELGTGSAEGRRTDSIMLIHVPSGGGKSAIISIPRDSYMPIPGHNSNKVNAAYAIGGPQLLVATIEQVTNLRIDGYLEIGLGGFANLVDSLGGVDICVPFNMNDKFAHINLKKGCQTLDGKNALGFVRARHSDPRGDIGRADRQRQFLAAIMKGAATPSTVLNPFRYWSFTHTAAGAVGVGQETSLRDASRILLAMRGAGNDSTLSLTVPLESTNYQTAAGSSVKWDPDRAQALFTMLREDQPLVAPPAGTDGKPGGG